MKRKLFFAALMLVLFGALYFLNNKDDKQPTQQPYVRLEGQAFGTFYHITVSCDERGDLQEIIERRLREFDNSLSTFNPNSTISKINQGGEDTDNDFLKMYATAEKIWKVSNGAFDITCAPLVNACGFGYMPDRNVSQSERNEIKRLCVGFEKTQLVYDTLSSSYKLKKANSSVKLDASAIAKGQGVDVVAELLDSLEVQDYMVEIGGEVRVKGVNDKNNDWLIGISKPEDDTLCTSYGTLQCATPLHNQSMATSGNYLQFYYKDGKRFSHTVDPRSAAPVEHSLLSASIIAENCMTADALATACMVVGLDSALTMINSLPNTEGFFIWADEKGSYNTSHTNGFVEFKLDE